jgi:lipopolysaccharide biosynthesis regulator YciM
VIEFSEIPGWSLAVLPVILLAVWYFSTRGKHNSSLKSHFSTEYFKGLNYLLNDEQGKALDIFVKLVESDWEMIETHFALGRIFRKNGEIDKAIKIHQGLIARPSLPERYRIRVLLELGNDYLGAGWFDRAEGLFREVLIHDPKSEKALRNLILIYQQEKDWHKAIDTAVILFGEDPASIGPMISQYYCELADIAKTRNDLNQVEHNANQALRYDALSVRASILLAELAMKAGDYRKAIRQYEHIEKQDAEFLPLVIDRLIECHERLKASDELLKYLSALNRRQQQLPLIEAHARVIEKHEGADAALEFVTANLRRAPSLQTINSVLEYQLENGSEKTGRMLIDLKTAVSSMRKEDCRYKCRKCGFRSNTLYWMCPSCHSWASVKPCCLSESI